MENINKWDIVMAQLGETHPNDSVQAGYRPVIICSNNLANRYSNVLTVIPLTGSKKKHLPTHVYLKDCGTTKKISIALAEQILFVSKSKLHKKIGTIKGTIYEEQIKKAITVQLDL